MLSRKTYEAQAAIIKKHVGKAYKTNDHKLDEVCYDMACELANYYAKDNPRFDRTRFFEACGVGGFRLRVKPVEYVDAIKPLTQLFKD
jgi:hypothetical protein